MHREGHRSVFGVYGAATATDAAVSRLRRAGFLRRDISVLMPARPGDESLAYRQATKASEGGMAGAAGGAIIGAGFGWIAGMGALGIPGIGPFVAAGPLLSAFAGAGFGGTVGGIAGALVGLGVPEYEARRYEGFVKEGNILLSVHVGNGRWAERARRILKESGARDIAVADEEKAPLVVPGNVRPLTRADDYALHK